MERLWAPWRMSYVGKPQSSGCIFCDKPALADSDAHIILRTRLGFLMLNAYPYNNGHLMAAVYKHTANLTDLSEDENLELMRLTRISVQILEHVSHPHGFNIGANLGAVAGAGVTDHLHLHIVPRWNGDTNFMPVLSDTKVLPEALDAVNAKLVQAVLDMEIT